MLESSRTDLQELEIAEAVQEQVQQTPTTSDPQLERVIVAVCLRSSWADAIASASLTENDFTHLPSRIIWKAKTTLSDRSVDHNPVTLQSEITSIGSLKAIGGEDGLKKYYEELGDEKQIGSYCEQLRNFTIARSQASAGRALQTLARKPMAAMERLEKTQEILTGIVTSGIGRSTMETPQEVVDRIGLDNIVDPSIGCGFIPTGWKPLDRLIIGFEQGSFNIVGARPSGGKTAFACELAIHTAIHQKRRTSFFSLEMRTKAILGRMACCMAQVDNDRYRRGEMDDESKDRFSTALYELTGAPLHISESRGFTVQEIEQELYAQIARDERPELAIIDHIHKMKYPGGRYKDLREAYTQIVEDLTRLFKKLGVACVMLSQFTKEGKKTGDRPRAADLRETGKLEENADIVLLLHQPYKYKPGATAEEKRIMEVIVDKQRDGRTGVVDFRFYGEYYRFESIDREVNW